MRRRSLTLELLLDSPIVALERLAAKFEAAAVELRNIIAARRRPSAEVN